MHMNMRSSFAGVYLRFLQLTATLEVLPGLQDFDADEKALFDVIVLQWAQCNPLTVRMAIGQKLLGSPATLHRRLKRLIAKDLVLAHNQGANKRAKYLEPSKKGLAYIEWLSSNIASAYAL